MRPAYFIAVHTRRRLVILSIRGTRSVHDLITDLALHSSAGGQDLGGGFAHFGSVEAARWLVATEAANLRSLLESHPGFRLCIVGHSLGASTASLLAAILQADARTLLNVAPERISAVAFATPPCASRDLAARTAPFVASVVNCDDVVARMSTAALDRLRAEILSIEWATMLKDTLISRDWPPEFATNAATTIVRHVAKLQDRFLASGPSSSSSASSHPSPTKLQGGTAAGPAAAAPPRSDPEQERKFVELVEKVLSSITGRQEVSKLAIDFWRAMRASKDVDFERGAPLGEGLGRSCDLFVPGTVYQIVGGSALAPSSATKREDQLQSVKGVFPGPGGDDGWSRIGLASVSGTDTGDPSHLERGAEKGEAHASRLDHRDYRALVKGLGEPRPGRIVLSNSMLLDHRIENYYYGLRDVLKNCG